ncbi:MAG: amidohydrolase [Gammaproteobacteria bacterium]|nr:amidohydrolase [Gammaproteobacteria bacterium]MDE0257766.1 amidohydrolase [Gammaproteobacteria bacterium]
MSKLSAFVPLTRSVFLLGVLIVACEPGPAEYADLVLTGGKVVTVDDARPEAEALAVTGYTITAVGTNEEIAGHVGPSTEVVELDGRLVIPGFIEGHGHYMSLGRSKMILDLTTATSWDDIVQMVGEASSRAAPGEWVTGRGWHQEKWTSTPEPNVDGVPLHTELSAASPENPVSLGHASGHASFANALAMQLAGIDDNTPDPMGGTIVRDASGAATGLMRETAQLLVSEAVARSGEGRSAEDVDAEFVRAVELAGAEALAYGVTSFQDAGSDFGTIDRLRALAAEGALPVRLYVMVRRESNEVMNEKLPAYRIIPEGNDFLAVRSIKRQIDGALGSHGAWLLENYIDIDNPGLVLETVEDITGTAEVAIRHGYQVNTHAIGDRANREVLDLYEKVFAANPDRTDLRWRIEHAQHLNPADVGRFAELDIIASMQGVHATSDGPWLADRLGRERMIQTSYVWRDILDAGVMIANGTDVPVEHISPIASFYSSVSRRMNNGQVLSGEHRMTREEALESYTINNAYAAFEEHLKGSLTPGKLADIVVLSQDIMTIPEDDIPATEVVYTIVGGEVRYSGPEG